MLGPVRLASILLLLGVAQAAHAVETVRFREADPPGPSAEAQVRTVVGEILVEAQDGGLMLQSDDGRIWTIQPDQILERSSDDKPLVPIDVDEMERRMLSELPAGFRSYRTGHFLFIHNTTDRYVQRVGGLFEQLHRGFFAYWRNQGWELPEARFPLVALVLKDHQSFLKHAGQEIGETAKAVIGYYHLSSNRVTTFHVPNLERNIATIIHEATHQLAYNCGVQRRFADNPMWVSEGLATFFEAPDFDTRRGWRSIGRVNRVNLHRWRKYVRHRPEDSLKTLLADDSRFRSSATAESAYAEAWALTYFLLRTRREAYVAYLRDLSDGAPLAEKTPRERIEMFEDAFDTSLAEIDRQLVLYMRRVR